MNNLLIPAAHAHLLLHNLLHDSGIDLALATPLAKTSENDCWWPPITIAMCMLLCVYFRKAPEKLAALLGEQRKQRCLIYIHIPYEIHGFV
jgi:hypothetical protein